jgi:hypothetical protein
MSNLEYIDSQPGSVSEPEVPNTTSLAADDFFAGLEELEGGIEVEDESSDQTYDDEVQPTEIEEPEDQQVVECIFIRIRARRRV